MVDSSDLFDAFQFPESWLVDRRIPKKRILEEAPTATDRRRITEGVERLQWRVVLKPGTTGIAGFNDDERAVEELSVLELELRSGEHRDRIVELIHRAIPYLLVIISQHHEELSVSVADKRWSLADKSKMVLDDDVVTAEIDSEHYPVLVHRLLEHLALTRQPQSNLYSVYQGWADAILAFRAGQHTGQFSMPDSPEHASERRSALKRVEMVDAEMTALRRTASREAQVARRAELNLRLQELRSERSTALAIL